jgi:hypothetical protein
MKERGDMNIRKNTYRDLRFLGGKPYGRHPSLDALMTCSTHVTPQITVPFGIVWIYKQQDVFFFGVKGVNWLVD